MGFGKRKIPVKHRPDHPLAAEMPLGQLPLDPPRPAAVPDAAMPADAVPQAVDLEHYAPREDGGPPRRRVIPGSAWEGESGDFLREAGFSPDDESNFAPDAHSVNQRLEQGKAEYEAKLAEMNQKVSERVPGGQMRGFSLIPDSIWNGPLGEFLMLQLELFPYDDWNLVFLPADEATAEALNLAVHPGDDVPELVESSEKLLPRAQVLLRTAQEEAESTRDFRRFQEEVEEIKEKIRGLARFHLGLLDEAWENRHG